MGHIVSMRSYALSEHREISIIKVGIDSSDHEDESGYCSLRVRARRTMRPSPGKAATWRRVEMSHLPGTHDGPMRTNMTFHCHRVKKPSFRI